MNETRDARVAAARARIAELAEKFLDRTAVEIETMRGRLAAPGDDATALAEIRNLAHRTCGTGATLGFETLSEYAHRIEALAAAQSPGAAIDAAARARIASAIDALAKELERQSRAGG